MTDSISNANMTTLANTPLTGARMRQDDTSGNWFEAFASAWGKALDQQAARIEQKSDMIANEGGDNPSQITMLTAEAMKMSFLSNSSHSSIDSVSKSLETMARKQ
ncbi:hypothetical protein U5A82_19495 [Sphingobium sp. CR2-8]|uniref:hypothetical protein n=1 Tax=Sphingobium sp. CR2-8 TaxID=1306534 RepID=UPI002DB82957|nr:hypothetical protein [Sphingobium sp. CR2-8]MEC3912578.1 hypothetical protein [Sphingobium sp. CR2-8]